MAGVRVLVVDDNELQLLVVADALASEGYDVSVAANGSEAVRAARARTPDILLLDLMLPDIDGATVLAQIRSDPSASGVRVILTTGVHSPDVRRLLRADAALYKPFGMRELIAAVEALASPASS